MLRSMDKTGHPPTTPSRRLYHPDPLSPGAVVTLAPGAARHVQALRLAPGDTVILFCGDGAECCAQITEAHRREMAARVTERREVDRESPLRATLLQGICAGDRMDWVIQKATELGVAVVQPLITERTVVRLDQERRERREQHWRNVAIAACEQCGRNRIPQIAPTLALEQFLGADSDVAAAAGQRILLNPLASTRIADLPPGLPVTIAVGPEGGFSPSERELLERYGFTPVRLGPRILRTETAPLVALALMQARWGDL
jgi:16S rRNA (uracil1498-N3)-methyltransferase